VKYTDYAIGKFIRDASKQDWFKDTIFVITADHQASSAGKTQLPLNKYHIPLIIYSPSNITPSINNNLGSQIDIIPTILSMLNFSYHSKFYGQDLIGSPPNRALISTYQLLGYFKDNILVILSPKANPIAYRIENNEQILIEAEQGLIDEAVAYYQSAYELFTKGEMKKGL
jgi:phosphoglycerol transferase MdoB-like AlkP superfamily enzyme